MQEEFQLSHDKSFICQEGQKKVFFSVPFLIFLPKKQSLCFLVGSSYKAICIFKRM